MRVENRIKKQADFQNVLNFGSRIRCDEYSISFQKNEFGLVRVGVSIPTKSGNAVVRNKIKRQIKAMLASFLPLDFSYDIVIIPRKNYKIKNFEHNKQALLELLKQTGVTTK